MSASAAAAAPQRWWAWPLAFAAALTLTHLALAGRYGYFRDELYFIAWTEHLDWGYVDHAPLAGLVLWVARTLFGDSLYAVRLFPALAAGAKVLLTARFVRELGGGRNATILGCLCVVFAPAYLGIDHLFSMNPFEPLFWTAAALALLLTIKSGEPRRLVWFGVAAGLGLMNKHSMAFFIIALAAGLLATPQRRLLASRWMWIGGAVALLIFLPNLLWQVQHGFPTVNQLLKLRSANVNVSVGPLEFLMQQIFIMGHLTALVWVAGLWFYLRDRAGAPYRTLGWAYLAALAMMMALNGKHYYLAAAYPMLYAAGAVWWERRAASLRGALAALIAAAGVASAPMVLPILPVEGYLRYQDAIGLRPPATEHQHNGVLPQHFGDMFGWPEMVEKTAAVYRSLSPEERAKAVIFTNNYGQAGAIDFFGPKYGLPKAVSPHLSYWLWATKELDPTVLIVLGDRRERAERSCLSVEERDEVGHPYGMPYERFRILICRGLKRPPAELWRRARPW